jgi:hypothetical protein
MRSVGGWPRTGRIRLHALLIAALVTANVVALFSLLWLARLALQALSLLEVFFFAYTYHRAETR